MPFLTCYSCLRGEWITSHFTPLIFEPFENWERNQISASVLIKIENKNISFTNSLYCNLILNIVLRPAHWKMRLLIRYVPGKVKEYLLTTLSPCSRIRDGWVFRYSHKGQTSLDLDMCTILLINQDQKKLHVSSGQASSKKRTEKTMYKFFLALLPFR